MFLLEANNTLTLLKDYIVPVAHSTVSLDFTDCIVILVQEANLVHPVFACLDSDLANLSRA